MYSHIFEMSKDFYDNTKNRKYTIISAYGGEISRYNASITAMCKSYVDAFYFLLPLIKKYYTETDTYENTLQNIEQNLKNEYLKIMNYEMPIVKVFIECAFGNRDSALTHLANIHFLDDEIKNKYQNALSKLDDINLIS